MPEQRAPLQDKEILLAVEDCRRLERILAGHRLTIPTRHMVILGVLFDESRMFELLRLVRTFDNNLNKFPDDQEGNARVRRIVDYLILIDGDMHGGFKTVHEDG